MPHIVNEIYKPILTIQPKYDGEFANVKQYLAEVCTDLAERKTTYELDFFSG